jgi:hypothetical protein
VHEDWEYKTKGESGIASLVGLRLSCWHCHAVEHFGATGKMVLSGELTRQAIEDTVEHFCRINGVGRDEFRSHLAEAKAEWMKLNQMKWTVSWGAFEPLVSSVACAK